MRYDANGNPVDVSDMHFHWTNGRMLDSITYTDDRGVEQPFMSFTYDDNGIRTSKTFGDTTTYYTNVDGAITSQYCLDEDGAVTDLMQFIYDGSNDLLGFTYNGATYFYVKNLQGDVIAVIDSAGAEKAVYEYGAYGTLVYSQGDLADVNPMRYRGYYYDSDFGGYYLQSRYYAPEFAKFINSDLPEYAQQQKADHYGTNLFAYCCNDPVNNSDPTGNWGESIHYGRDKNKKDDYDGTYEWAIASGFKSRYAKSIAKGNASVDTNKKTTPAPFKGDKNTDLAERQKYHFNRNQKGLTDSRKVEGDIFIEKAITKFTNAKKEYNKAISELKKKYSTTSETYKNKQKELIKKRNEKLNCTKLCRQHKNSLPR